MLTPCHHYISSPPECKYFLRSSDPIPHASGVSLLRAAHVPSIRCPRRNTGFAVAIRWGLRYNQGESGVTAGMALYAIGDLHLHFQSECKAPMQRTERVWRNHEEVFLRNCRNLLTQEDTLVLLGDHSWGKNLAQCEQDLAYIAALPGRKILLRGNHDMFWDARKTRQLNERFEGRLSFLQNNFYPYGDFALVGTKGYTFEGPFYLDRRGRLTGWDREAADHAERLVAREVDRLRASFEAAKAAGFEKFIMFLHYPPTNILQKQSAFTDMAEAYGARQVIYAHCHGESRFHDSIQGRLNGIDYKLVSGDFLRWMPEKIL